MDQVFSVRQVCEKYRTNEKMYFGSSWIWKRLMILLMCKPSHQDMSVMFTIDV